MDVRSRLNEAMKDAKVTDRKMLEAFLAFANRELAQATRTFRRTNKALRQIRHDLEK